MIKSIKIFISLVLICFAISPKLHCQDHYTFKQYLVEDGLPHNIINNIIQDKKGFIWIATTNGLSKYNGYYFKNYKPKLTDKVKMKNNRIDKLVEDSYGRIWMKSVAVSPKTFCFNPKTETFWSPELLPNLINKNFEVSQIIANKSGFVWLLSKSDGCILVKDSLYNSKVFHKNKGNLTATTINNVFEDSENKSWLLTNHGLTLVNSKNIDKKPKHYLWEDNKSNNFICAIEVDDDIWFGGSGGVIAKYSKQSDNFRSQKLEQDTNIIRLEKIDKQNILAITDQKGFFIINIFTGEIETYNSNTIKNLNTNDLNTISFTKNHQLWFVNGTKKGINLFDFRSNTHHYFPPNFIGTNKSSVPVSALVLTDSKGNVWVQPYAGGLSKYNPLKHSLEPLNGSSHFPYNSFTNSLHTAFFDKQDCLWYNSQSSGLVKVTFSDYNFKTLNPSEGLNILSKNVRAILQDKNENIWVGTKYNEVIIFDKSLNKIGNLSLSGILKKSATWNKTAYSIIEDSKSNIWIGTRGDGLYKLIPQSKPFTYKVKHYKNDETDLFSISDNDIYEVFEDSNGQIWVGTFNGLNLISENQKEHIKFINFNNNWKTYPTENFFKIRCINQTKDGVILVGCTAGLLAINPTKNILSEFSNAKTYSIENNHQNGLRGNDIIDICVTKNKETILATADGGISKVISKNSIGFPIRFKSFGVDEGLASNNMLALLEDDDGKVWCATDYMLTRFSPKKEFFEVFPEVKWTITNNNFSEATAFKLKTGELLFGYTDGILHFYPDQIKSNYYSPYLALTDFKLYNKEVSINDTSSPLNMAIDNCKNITLAHNQNFFNIEFSSLDYKNPENIKYSFKLEGFDDDWNTVYNQRTAYYTNVPKGHYTFKVKSTNSQGNWVENERQLFIEIKPSIWNTTISYIIYGILILGLILLINYTVITIYRLKTNSKLEKEMFNMKQKFFIDISHELRTPLTLISAPIEYLINDNRTPDIIKKQLSYISQSSNRLQRLVNQILDFRKIQDVTINVSEINLIESIREVFDSFTEIAIEKNIKFTFHSETETLKIWADKNGVEKIMMNLISNAFKYTPNGKSIDIVVTKEAKQVCVSVIDQGIGIPKDNQNKLFNRFVSFNQDLNNPSTGIGLSIVKELAEKHQAKLIFESEANKGSSFSIYFKSGREHFKDQVKFIEEPAKNQESIQPSTQTIEISNKNNDEKLKILIVEDDDKLRAFIKSILENEYIIFEAENGKIGYDLVLEKTPDFIISDLMMPELDGVELLKKIRSNIEISHVPVILLTAKTNIESKLEGLSYGADDYITKPFSVSYLKARIINLFEQRKRLQKIFDSYEKTPHHEFNPKPGLISDQDEEIMVKVMEIIEQNIDNNTFSVETLGLEVGLNRTSFYYKIKSLTGYTPVEFIRDIRIKRAAQLAANSQLLIKEIAYSTGFSDMKYFTKSFKAKFGLTPTEYRKQNR